MEIIRLSKYSLQCEQYDELKLCKNFTLHKSLIENYINTEAEALKKACTLRVQVGIDCFTVTNY